jgi:hypothetical protein
LSLLCPQKTGKFCNDPSRNNMKVLTRYLHALHISDLEL